MRDKIREEESDILTVRLAASVELRIFGATTSILLMLLNLCILLLVFRVSF